MSNDFVFYIYLQGWKPGDNVIISVVQGQQAMLDKVVELTKSETKFAVYKVGECVGDYS